MKHFNMLKCSLNLTKLYIVVEIFFFFFFFFFFFKEEKNYINL